jgi:DMSO reductase family type II enzyme chaperone
MYRNPIIRSSLYKLLSVGFRYPTPKILKIFQNGEFLDGLIYNISQIPGLDAEELLTRKDVLEGIAAADLEIRFTRTFDAGSPVPPCPPYEGFYCQKPRSIVMLEVSEFYDCFGLHMSQDEGKREFPDHICAELEFLHFLAFEEANSDDEEKRRKYLLAQKDFLEHHPALWIPEFCLKLQRLQNPAGFQFYSQLAKITSLFIKNELVDLFMTKSYYTQNSII